MIIRRDGSGWGGGIEWKGGGVREIECYGKTQVSKAEFFTVGEACEAIF